MIKLMQITGEDTAPSATPETVQEDALSRALRELAEQLEQEEVQTDADL